jgi:AcrR family transcriptional regulator
MTKARSHPGTRPVTHPVTRKGDVTRAKILEAALRLFFERGFEGTGMRAVAEKAGVSLGNAYYYFESKDHLVQGFYTRTHEEHLDKVRPVLEREAGLKERLAAVLVTKLETAEPYHDFAGHLFKTAADPRSPLNPFSAESEPVRKEATALMAEVVEGAKAKVPEDLREELPDLLWLYEMAIILFWIHDDSEGRVRSMRLIDRTVELVTRLISLASFPLMRPLRKTTLKLLEDLRRPRAPETAEP